jgi:tetratricopeptide (TPR) repeat protein
MTRPELEDERSFLLRSLEDLDREHDAGDLSDEDHEALRDEYVARAAAVLRSTKSESAAAAEPVVPAASTGRPRRAARPTRRHGARAPATRWRRVLVAAGVIVVIGGAVWALAAQLSGRLPGETVTGSVTVSGSEQTARTLAQAQILEGRGDAAGALKLYGSVLRQQPNQEEALAESGWLEFEAGAEARQATLLTLGEQQERKAESAAPSAFAPHLYLGSMLLAEGHPVKAVAEYRQFLADHPPRATVATAVPFLTKAFADAHEPLPELPTGKSSPR